MIRTFAIAACAVAVFSGSAVASADPAGQDAGVFAIDAMTVLGKRPMLALEIDVEEVFVHCAKAFMRSDAWKPETWNPTALPSAARIAQAIKKDMTLAELEAYYAEDNMRKILY
jgi:hypothetical protein